MLKFEPKTDSISNKQHIVLKTVTDLGHIVIFKERTPKPAK